MTSCTRPIILLPNSMSTHTSIYQHILQWGHAAFDAVTQHQPMIGSPRIPLYFFLPLLLVLVLLLRTPTKPATCKRRTRSPTRPLEALLTVLTPTRSVWPSYYLQSASGALEQGESKIDGDSRVIQLEMRIIWRDLTEGRVELREWDGSDPSMAEVSRRVEQLRCALEEYVENVSVEGNRVPAWKEREIALGDWKVKLVGPSSSSKRPLQPTPDYGSR